MPIHPLQLIPSLVSYRQAEQLTARSCTRIYMEELGIKELFSGGFQCSQKDMLLYRLDVPCMN